MTAVLAATLLLRPGAWAAEGGVGWGGTTRGLGDGSPQRGPGAEP